MFRQLAAVSVAALIFSVGCASNTGLTGARAIAEEELQVGVALSFLPSFVESDIVGLPVLDLIFRYGLSAEQDLGFRINTLGAFAVDTKVYDGMITSSPSSRSNNSAAISSAAVHECVSRTRCAENLSSISSWHRCVKRPSPASCPESTA